MIFFEKKHEFGTNYIDFLEKKLKSVFFFRKKSEFYQNIHDFLQKKHMNFEQILLIFLKKKAEKCDFFLKNPNLIKIFMIFFEKNMNFEQILLIFLK